MSDDAILREKQRRLRELKQQQARYGINTPPEITIEIEDLEVEIAQFDGGAARAGLPRPPQPDFAHPYPIQSGFTGRVAERKMLTGWLSSSSQPVLAVIGIGGMGKSAFTWAWLLRDILGLPLPGATEDAPDVAAACRLPDDSRPEGVLWWSFYETQAGFASFLDEAISYVSDHNMNSRDLPSTYDKARTLLSLLQQRRVLLVLDGFERELRAYSSLGAAYQGDAAEKEERGEHRACADPHAGRFLRDAATLPLQSRILITSRLFPRELDDLAGCRRQDLATIDPEDAVTFFQSQGIRGTRAEIQSACALYGYHALALRLLAGLVVRDPYRPGDVHAAAEYNPSSNLVRHEHHILEVSYQALRPRVRDLLSRLAAFRLSLDDETADAIFCGSRDGNKWKGMFSHLLKLDRRPLFKRQDFKKAMQELVARGFVSIDPSRKHYDLHPIIRGYAYDRLANKTDVHVQLRDYFAAVPTPVEESVQSTDDLISIIELYHHTVRAERYDEACTLYRSRLHSLLYFDLGEYQTCIEMLRVLFPDGEEYPSKLRTTYAEAWCINRLANSYAACGQPRRAEALAIRSFELFMSQNHPVEAAYVLDGLCDDLLKLGKLAIAEQTIQQFLDLSTKNKRKSSQASAREHLGRLLIYLALFDAPTEELNTVPKLSDERNNQQIETMVWANSALHAILTRNVSFALLAAHNLEVMASRINENARIVQADWLLGMALLAQAEDYGLELTHAEERKKTLQGAEMHINKALMRCRRTDLVYFEPDILLAWAKWHQLQGSTAQARAAADEALAIADRCEYRLTQADIHNFLARLALDAGDRAATRSHAGIAKERAWCDGPPHCYKPALDEAERLLGEIG